MSTVELSNLQQICRTCLQHKDDMEPLRKFQVPEMLAAFTSIKIELDDGLPVLVCSECLNQIRNCYNFKQQCENNNRLLQQIRLGNTYDFFQSVYYTDQKSKNETADVLNDKKCKDEIKNALRESSENNFTDANYYSEILVEQDNTDKDDSDSDPDDSKQLTERNSPISNLKTKNTAESKRNNFECKVCNKVLTTTDSLERHVQKHNESKYKCIICHQYYGKRHAGRHMHLHEMEERDCEICSEKFSSLKKCAEHTKKHNLNLTSCTLCDEQFILKPQLEIHMMKVHLNKADNECTVCGKQFLYPSKLERHKITHLSVRSFSCEECDSKFKDANALKIHFKTVHQGIKQYKRQLCKICGISVIQLQQHIWAKHSKEKPFNCKECEASYVTKQLLSLHIRSKHKGEELYSVLCNVCGKRWRSQAELKIHMRIHTKERPFSCAMCDKSFASTSALNSHTRTHTGERPYPCATCGKSFACSSVLKKHKRIHTGEKPYVCKVCEKSFRQRCVLVTHMKIH